MNWCGAFSARRDGWVRLRDELFGTADEIQRLTARLAARDLECAWPTSARAAGANAVFVAAAGRQ